MASAAGFLANLAMQKAGVWNTALDRVAVLSRFASELAIEAGLDASKIVLLDNFVPDHGERAARASMSSDVLFVGRLSPEKGILELARSWGTVAGADLRLVIVGTGELLPDLMRLEEPRISVLGPKTPSEVQQLMRSCRALAFPSRWFEGQPLVILEALAAGLPIVSADHPPLEELLKDAGQIVVGPDDWVDALHLVADDGLVDAASTSGRITYLDRFTPEIGYTKRVKLYSAVIEERRSQ